MAEREIEGIQVSPYLVAHFPGLLKAGLKGRREAGKGHTFFLKELSEQKEMGNQGDG